MSQDQQVAEQRAVVLDPEPGGEPLESVVVDPAHPLLSQLAAQVNLHGQQITALTVDSARQSTLIEGQTGQIADLAKRVGSQSDQIGELRVQVAEIQTDMRYLKAQIGGHTAQIGDLTAKTNNLTTQVHDLTAKTDGLTAQVHDLTAKTDGLTAQVDNLTTQMGDLTTQVHDLTAQMGGLTAQVHDLTAKTDGLTTQVHDLTAKTDGLTTQVHDLTAKTDGLTTQVDNLTAQMGDLTAKTNNLTAQMGDLTAKTDGLPAQMLQAMDQRLAPIENQLAAMAGAYIRGLWTLIAILGTGVISISVFLLASLFASDPAPPASQAPAQEARLIDDGRHGGRTHPATDREGQAASQAAFVANAPSDGGGSRPQAPASPDPPF